MPPIETGFGSLNGSLTIAVLDPSGLTPTNIIRTADPWQLVVDWQLNGTLVGMISGTWRVVAYLESIGPQAENIPPIVDMNVSFASGINPINPFVLTYHQPIIIPASQAPAAGVYKLVVVLTCLTPAGTPGAFAGFAEGPLMQFYAAP